MGYNSRFAGPRRNGRLPTDVVVKGMPFSPDIYSSAWTFPLAFPLRAGNISFSDRSAVVDENVAALIEEGLTEMRESGQGVIG